MRKKVLYCSGTTSFLLLKIEPPTFPPLGFSCSSDSPPSSRDTDLSPLSSAPKRSAASFAPSSMCPARTPPFRLAPDEENTWREEARFAGPTPELAMMCLHCGHARVLCVSGDNAVHLSRRCRAFGTLPVSVNPSPLGQSRTLSVRFGGAHSCQ